jgi:hypothetical protein
VLSAVFESQRYTEPIAQESFFKIRSNIWASGQT